MSSQNRLQQNILLYNSQFESKMIEGSAKLVLWDQRNKFIRDALAITEKINFYDSSIVGM
ncbi:MAG: hypothetical protein GWM98_18370, partial [Nitrospinaceae bacterium]|nr:hypothetical protein [Nitrospinaceae bacterium]NIR56097.1 hypothetical protein [Nitrospinaceae bacterium]NIS86545.1 hypothetical protein [Nitrospinaceae bacterium]NIT83379.1 hypothetical protein [Nitrospinaceae bacterium]NIU45589.1 hypothetical protein [Nitrospinaceae bacterium]